MAPVTKIDSNITGLAIAQEASLRTLPGTPVWVPLEPNSYQDFGGQVQTLARNPINPSRQRKKGRAVDIDVSGGFNTDLTQENLQNLMQGFFFADFRTKGEAKNPVGVTTALFAAATSGSQLTRSGTPALDLTTVFSAGDLVLVKGFDNAANNGIFELDAVGAATLDLNDADASGTPAVLVDESANNAVSVVRVGVQATTADIDVDITGTFPALESTALDFTTLGLFAGDWVFVGGDAAALRFTTAGNNGFCRVRRITPTRLEFDKTAGTMANETGTGKTIQLFLGRSLKNESGSLIKRRSYQLERQLGAPDDASPSQIQSEYLVGAVPNEITFNWQTASKLESDLTFVALDVEQRTGVTGVKAGTRVPLVEADAFTTSSDVVRAKLSIFSDSNSNPAPLFAFATDFTISINNNVTPNKAIGVFGAFEATAGTFEVGGNITAYFASVEAVQAVRNTADVTLEVHMVRSNAGVTFDLPLITLGDGRAAVELDQPITLPLTSEAATGAKIDPNLNHTLLMVFWDYLPSLAG